MEEATVPRRSGIRRLGSRLAPSNLWESQPLGDRERFHSYDATAFTAALTNRHINTAKMRMDSWELPGWGAHYSTEVPPGALDQIESRQQTSHHPKLTEWFATAICGNDILSSVLFVNGLVTAAAGTLAPVCLLVVAGILHLYRYIYGEAISALPMNGGSYTVLLNATGKSVAAMAACFTTMSYITTSVVSAASAIAYLQKLLPAVDLVEGTILLLLAFACLTVMGISESSRVALVVFCLHVGTLAVLCMISSLYAVCERSTFVANLDAPFPDIPMGDNVVDGTWLTALLFGVSTAFLGVSGFESSAQFVQEQAEGVFHLTLRNMWWGVAVFNPAICVLSFCVLRMDEIVEDKEAMLAAVAHRVGYWLQDRVGDFAPGSLVQLVLGGLPLGRYLEAWVCLDAFVVLSGAVLTGYVGITGLIRTMAQDRCLPQFLLSANSWRGTHHYIIFGFFLVSASQVLMLGGDVEVLSGIYTFSFLLVMAAFAVGCMLLKVKRPSLPRAVVAPYPVIALGLTAVTSAFLVSVVGKPEVLSFFLLYFFGVGAVVLAMFLRIRLLKLVLAVVRALCPNGGAVEELKLHIKKTLDEPIVFFCKHADLYVLNKAIQYVQNNEQTHGLLVAHVSQDPDSPVIKALSTNIDMFNGVYPRLSISLVTVTVKASAVSPVPGSEGAERTVEDDTEMEYDHFSPALVEWLSNEWGVPKNMMFITCPDSHFKYKLEHLGGVRVITH